MFWSRSPCSLACALAGVNQETRALQLAAEEGDAAAQHMLGQMYLRGEGVAQDYGEAVRLYRLAAEQGDAEAQTILGEMYLLGRVVPQDDVEAARWFRLAFLVTLLSSAFPLLRKTPSGRGQTVRQSRPRNRDRSRAET